MKRKSTTYGTRFAASLVALLMVLSVIGSVGTVSAQTEETLLESDFEEESLNETAWTHQSEDIDASAGINDNTSNSGETSAYHHGAAGALVSQAMNASGTNYVEVSYWVQKGAEDFSEEPEANESLVVEYRDDEGNWEEVARYDEELEDGEEVSETLNISDTGALHDNLALRFRQQGADDPNGDYWHVDDVSVTAASEGSNSGSSGSSGPSEPDDVAVGVDSTSMSVNDTSQVTVTATDMNRGLSLYELRISVENGSTAEIVGADYPDTMGHLSEPELSDGNSTVRVHAVDVGRTSNPSADTSQELAHVEVRGEDVGASDVTVDVVQIEDDNDDDMVVMNSTAGAVTVSPPAIENGSTPQDLDGDGNFEDVDGDGNVTSDDVDLLFEIMSDTDAESDRSAYDFNDNGRLDFDDLVTLSEAHQQTDR